MQPPANKCRYGEAIRRSVWARLNKAVHDEMVASPCETCGHDWHPKANFIAKGYKGCKPSSFVALFYRICVVFGVNEVGVALGTRT